MSVPMTLAQLLGGGNGTGTGTGTGNVTANVTLPEGSRPWLLAGTSVSAVAFGWSALMLPWRPEAPLALLAWALSVLHGCTALTVLGRPERVGRPLRALALCSIVAAPVFVFAVAITSFDMVEMYGPLGWALSVALGAIGWLLVLGTVPVAIFGWYATRSTDARG
jgi:hypothetical protein